jgi:hypothetical protein
LEMLNLANFSGRLSERCDDDVSTFWVSLFSIPAFALMYTPVNNTAVHGGRIVRTAQWRSAYDIVDFV